MMSKTTKIVLKRQTKFRGPRKIGIDSSCLYDLISSPELFSHQHARIFKTEGIFYTHRICFSEVRDKLMEKENYSKDEAEKEVKNFLKNNNINIIEKEMPYSDRIKNLLAVGKHSFFFITIGFFQSFFPYFSPVFTKPPFIIFFCFFTNYNRI